VRRRRSEGGVPEAPASRRPFLRLARLAGAVLRRHSRRERLGLFGAHRFAEQPRRAPIAATRLQGSRKPQQGVIEIGVGGVPIWGRRRAMAFGETTVGGAALVKPDGRIDMSNAEAFQKVLESAVQGAKNGVVVDMANVDYISSAGLRALMIAFRAAKAGGKGFGVAALTPLVLEIFTISRFNLVFPLYGAVGEALAAVGERA
jgi:anti-anti-sigma factor